MRNILFKGITVAVAAAALGTLGTVGTAAAGNGYAQVQVCNTSGTPLQFVLHGINQHEDFVGTNVRPVGPNSCASVNDWWFRRFTVSWAPKPPFDTHQTQNAPSNANWVRVNIKWPR